MKRSEKRRLEQELTLWRTRLWNVPWNLNKNTNTAPHPTYVVRPEQVLLSVSGCWRILSCLCSKQGSVLVLTSATQKFSSDLVWILLHTSLSADPRLQLVQKTKRPWERISIFLIGPHCNISSLNSLLQSLHTWAGALGLNNTAAAFGQTSWNKWESTREVK